MDSKNSEYILKVCAITTGAALLLVCMCLYLGDDCMRKCIEASFWTKIILSVILGLVFIVIVVGIILGIWYCKQNCDFNDYKDFLPTYDSGVVIIRENNTEDVKSCTVMHYDTLEIYVANVSDNDTVYVYDSESTINASTLAKLGEKKNIELQFMNSNAKINEENASHNNKKS